MKKYLIDVIHIIKKIGGSLFRKGKKALKEEYIFPDIDFTNTLKVIPLIYFLGLVYNYWYFSSIGLSYFWYFDIKDVFVTNSEFWIVFAIFFSFVGLMPFSLILESFFQEKKKIDTEEVQEGKVHNKKMNFITKGKMLVFLILYFFIISFFLKIWSNILLDDWFSLWPVLLFFILIPFVSKNKNILVSLVLLILFFSTLFNAKFKSEDCIRKMKLDKYSNSVEIYGNDKKTFFGFDYPNLLLIEKLSNYFILYDNIKCNYLIYNTKGDLKYDFPLPIEIQKKIQLED